MRNSTSAVRTTPFRNLKFFMIINKMFGLVSCKVVNGRLKRSSWGRGYCAFWLFFHCAYSIAYYYIRFTTPAKNLETQFELNILRYTAFFVSLLPYSYVAAFRDEDFVMFSQKLETYDDKAIALGHKRKDKHIFAWIYFVYTFCASIVKTYYTIDDSIEEGTVMAFIIAMMEVIVPVNTGTCCVFICCICLDLIRQCFRHLNEVIVPRVSELPVTGSEGEITVYDVRYMHSVLFDSAQLINSLYGVATLFTFLSILLECISMLYKILKNPGNEVVIVIMFDVLFQTIYLFLMYHLAAYEANRVEERVRKYGLSFQNDKCRLDKIEMMLYFYHKRFSFTAAEFFVVDLTIILPVASSVTTFILLLI